MRPRTLPPGTVRWTEYDGGRYVFGVVQTEDGETRTAAVLLEVVAPPGNEVAARMRRQIAEALMRDQGRELEEERPSPKGSPCST
jgi:hypothetical protein